ncbi:MAG: AP2 domain-containing protein [Chloroflexota bacterium]
MSHIVRINNPKRHTMGWQFRARNKTKFFSDSKHGGKKGAEAAAKAYQKAYKEENPQLDSPHKPFHQGPYRWRNNTSGTTGVYRTHEYNRHDKTIKREYWAAHYTIDQHGRTNLHRHKKFYVDVYGEDDARRKAILFRREWEKAAKKSPDAVREFFREQERDNDPVFM